MRRFFKWGIIGTVLLLMCVLGISSCVSFDFRMKPEQVKQHFDAQKVTATHQHYKRNERPMHYVMTGDAGPLVVFVHGSPGSWDNYIHFLSNKSLLARARMASVDRPGFGESGAGLHQPSMAEQAADIVPLIQAQKQGQPVVLVGHSLGGPVVARLAMDFPDLVDAVIMVAPSIDPELEKTKWYQIPAEWKLLSWMVPSVLQVTNREILPLKGELEKMLPLWKNIRMPVTVIQGELDKLVPAGNADFAAKVLTKDQLHMVRVADMNHFVPWNRPDLIEQAIFRHLDALEAPTKEEGIPSL